MTQKAKPRILMLNLTDEEVKGLTARAIRAGLSVGTLLESFIADLTRSEREGGGIDEAREWYYWRDYTNGGKCCFSGYLAEYDEAQRFFNSLDDYETFKAERDYLEAHPEEAEPGKLEEIINEVVIARDALEEYLKAYRRSNPEATLESIIANAKAHERELTDHGRATLENEPTE